MTTPSRFPNRLRQLRDAAGLSQKDLAERINEAARSRQHSGAAITAGAISRWERGTNIPVPLHRRLIADALGVRVEDLHLITPTQSPAGHGEMYVTNDVMTDPRVTRSQEDWRATRRALNTHRHALAQITSRLYPPQHRLGTTGLITHPSWIPSEPVTISNIQLTHHPDAPKPLLNGTEGETALVRPHMSVTRHYPRYTHAVRDLAHPRLFENRLCWRLTDIEWAENFGAMGFADALYFDGVDVFEAASHELAYVALDRHGNPSGVDPNMRDLPFRRLIGNPFDLTRRPLLTAISTLTIRAGNGSPSFILHRRDPRSVTIAGGMLQVIPSGIFQPSSIMPTGQAQDFTLWRNIMREYSEELLGNPEHDGDGQPVDYHREPFSTFDSAYQDGRFRVHCLGIALDALSLFGEILTVAVVEADLFDTLARDFVDLNDEGQVLNVLAPFTKDGLDRILGSGQLAPAGAGCVTLAWQHRQHLLGPNADGARVSVR